MIYLDIDFSILFIFLIISIFLNYVIIKFSFHSKSKKNVQDIHIGNPSRLGGLTIFLSFSGYVFLFQNNFNHLILIALIMMIPAFLEDLMISINPLIRLTLILITCFIFTANFTILPQFNFGNLNFLFNHKIFQIIFFTIAMAGIINGQNLIDGTNGLSAFTALSYFLCILFLGYYTNDLNIIKSSSIIIVLIISFLLFNYPFGKLFLGDGGSYFLGLLGSYFIIDIFSKNPQLPTWSAVSILFYPALEVSFSYFRKIIQKKSPFLPDNNHLHLKIYYLILNKRQNKVLFNALVAPFLAIIWLSPLAVLNFSIYYPIVAILIILLLILAYILFYLAIPSLSEKKPK